MEPGRLRWLDVRYWPENKLSEYENLLVNLNEIIIAMDRPVISTGLKVAKVKECDLPCVLVQRMTRIRESENIQTDFILAMINHDNFIKHCLGKQTGTQLPHISEAQIKSYIIPLPPYKEQSLIVSAIESRLSLADNLEKTIDAALSQSAALRQSILKRAFEGKLVPQDPSDEPAEKLLERIKTERLSLEKQRKRGPNGKK